MLDFSFNWRGQIGDLGSAEIGGYVHHAPALLDNNYVEHSGVNSVIKSELKGLWSCMAGFDSFRKFGGSCRWCVLRAGLFVVPHLVHKITEQKLDIQ